jgi:hypothetical protein
MTHEENEAARAESQAIRNAIAWLSHLLVDLEESDMDKNPENGQVYESHEQARLALEHLRKVAPSWLP